MIRRNYLFLLVCVAAVYVMGCPTATTRTSQIESRVNGYHSAYKAGDIMKASTFVQDPEDYKKRMKGREKGFEITEIRVVNVNLNADYTEADVEVERSYIENSTMTMHTETLEQKWKYDRRKTDWFLVSPY